MVRSLSSIFRPHDLPKVVREEGKKLFPNSNSVTFLLARPRPDVRMKNNSTLFLTSVQRTPVVRAWQPTEFASDAALRHLNSQKKPLSTEPSKDILPFVMKWVRHTHLSSNLDPVLRTTANSASMSSRTNLMIQMPLCWSLSANHSSKSTAHQKRTLTCWSPRLLEGHKQLKQLDVTKKLHCLKRPKIQETVTNLPSNHNRFRLLNRQQFNREALCYATHMESAKSGLG